MCYNDEAELESGMVRKNSTVTLKDIAQELGLSVKAVSTGLNGTGRLSPETRKKIQEAARRMGYTPNVAARSLVTHRSSFIGVLVPYLNSSFFRQHHRRYRGSGGRTRFHAAARFAGLR